MTIPPRETVTIVRGVTKDAYGDRTGTPTEVDVEDCAVAPDSSDELHDDGRDGVVTLLKVFAPPGSDFRASDQVRVRGLVYDVLGTPESWPKGVVVQLRRVDG